VQSLTYRMVGDVYQLQEILTHSTLEMSKEYAQNYCKDLSRNHQQTNPLECYKKRKQASEKANKRISMN